MDRVSELIKLFPIIAIASVGVMRESVAAAKKLQSRCKTMPGQSSFRVSGNLTGY